MEQTTREERDKFLQKEGEKVFHIKVRTDTEYNPYKNQFSNLYLKECVAFNTIYKLFNKHSSKIKSLNIRVGYSIPNAVPWDNSEPIIKLEIEWIKDYCKDYE